jgi:tetratricopeptide (TPR) repeat protein
MLQEGIAAIKRRDYARGRDLLLQVVEQDDQIEPAWLWLSEAMDDPQDKVTALENVLAINPNNDKVRQRLDQLNRELTAAAPPAAPAERSAVPAGDAEHWKQLLPQAALEADDNVDDPYQCVYCGKLTAPEHRVCPHCGKKLHWRVRQSEGWSEVLKLALLFIGIDFGIGSVELLGPLFALNVAGGGDLAFFREVLLKLFGVEAFMGNFLRLAPGTAQLLTLVYAVRLGLLLVFLLGLARQWTVAYYGSIVTLGLDLLLSIYLALSGDLGLIGSVLNFLLAVAILGFLFASYPEFAVNEERLLTQPDTTARGAIDFYKRGHDYRKLGMWALAVAQWRRAVGLAPKDTLYYKDLGIGYAQIKRYSRSLRVLEEAQRQAPQDQSIPEIIALVRAQAEKAAPPKR